MLMAIAKDESSVYIGFVDQGRKFEDHRQGLYFGSLSFSTGVVAS
jgi:hypothetical protein